MIRLLMAACGQLFCALAWAADLQFDGGGELIGALGVVVDATSYNVSFVDGSCVDAYTDCGDGAAFVFSDLSTAFAAGQQLIDQVFTPAAGVTVSGCSSGVCQAWFPYGVAMSTESGINAANSGALGTYSSSIVFNTSSQSLVTRAVWEPSDGAGAALNVPALPVGGALGLGLLLLLAGSAPSRSTFS